MDCNEITVPELLVYRFRQSNKTDLNRVFTCFFSLFYEDFLRFTVKFCHNKLFAKHKEEDLAGVAFDDGLLAFYHKIKAAGFEETGASVKTAFLSFAIMKLRGELTSLTRHYSRQTITDDILVYDKTNETGDPYTAEGEQTELYKKALAQLKERDRKLVEFGKILKLKKEEIAKLMDIKPISVNNEVYKSVCNLKKIIYTMMGKN